MKYFKIIEYPFYNKRAKIKSGAEFTLTVNINAGYKPVKVSAPAWTMQKVNFINPVFLN